MVELLRQLELKGRVLVARIRMPEQVIAESDLDLEEIRVRFNHVQVMGVLPVHQAVKVAAFRKYHFMFLNVLISKGGEGREEEWSVCQAAHTDEDVDHRFGCQTWYGCAAHMLHANYVRGDGSQDASFLLFVLKRPLGIIRDNNYRGRGGHAPIIFSIRLLRVD